MKNVVVILSVLIAIPLLADCASLHNPRKAVETEISSGLKASAAKQLTKSSSFLEQEDARNPDGAILSRQEFSLQQAARAPDLGLSVRSDGGAASPSILGSQRAPVPGGVFLGTVGFETLAFKKKCMGCCRGTRKRLPIDRFPFISACKVCKIGNVPPKPEGQCAVHALLGFFDAPYACFFDRCHQMLKKGTGGSCSCFR